MPLTPKNDVYAFAGTRIQVGRVLMGMSQEQLAEITGITLYMIKRYEAGEGKITMDRLDVIASALDVPEAYFYNQLEFNKPDIEIESYQ